MRRVHTLADFVPGLGWTISSLMRRALALRPYTARRVILVAAVALASALAYYVGAPRAPGGALLDPLFFPLTLLQRVTCALALLWAADTIAAERQRGTWDILLTTSRGPELLIRTRWNAVFYRMRPLLVILIVPRALLVGQAVVAVARYHGHHLDLYLIGAASEVSLTLAVILLAAGLAADMVGVLVLLGLNTAAGLLVAAVFRERALARAMCAVLLAGEFLLPLGVSQLRLEAGVEGTVEAVVTGSNSVPFSSATLAGSLGQSLEVTPTLQSWADGRQPTWWGSVQLAVLVVEALVAQGLLALATRCARESTLARWSTWRITRRSAAG